MGSTKASLLQSGLKHSIGNVSPPFLFLSVTPQEIRYPIPGYRKVFPYTWNSQTRILFWSYILKLALSHKTP